MKVWAKVMDKDKIRKDVLLEFADSKYFTLPEFKKLMQDISNSLDVSTPVVLKSHYEHFSKFNRAKFLPRDFIEPVDYTCVVVEVGYEKKSRTLSDYDY